jgi:hypothetical protein
MSDIPIPTEAWRAAMRTYHREVRRNPGNAWQAAIRAGIEAWPGRKEEIRDGWNWADTGAVTTHRYATIILPLPRHDSP